MSGATDVIAHGDGDVSPWHKQTPRQLRPKRAVSPPFAAGVGEADTDAGADGEAETRSAAAAAAAAADTATSFPEIEPEAAAAATEPFPAMDDSGGGGGHSNGLPTYSMRADPDAQATVTDFLDFTEYLPSDITRSLTLIGKLDEAYLQASDRVHELTDLWGRLPSQPPAARPPAVQLRADISAQLRKGHRSRVYAHAEAVRMAENVNRHYHRAKTILTKLRTMLDNYPAAEQQQQEQQQQKQQQQQQQQHQQQQQQQLREQERAGSKKATGASRARRPRVPRITVPGEVLAPYDLDYESYSDESDVSSPSSEDETPPPPMTTGARRTTPGTQPRIKVIKALGAGGRSSFSSSSSLHGLPKMPKTPKVRVPRAPRLPGQPYISTSSALAKLKPPPENAVIGSSDAPWLQLTPYELAKLRKRMKKNAQWTPSETMIARELKMLGRNLDAFNAAKKRAEDEGRAFEGALPEATVEPDGVARAPLGALSVDAALAAEDNQLTNRGMKLNEAKKLKNSRLGQLAAQEAEESARRLWEAARAMLSPYGGAGPAISVTSQPSQPAPSASRKRKREPGGAGAGTGTGGAPEGLADTVEAGDAMLEAGGHSSAPQQQQQQQQQQRQLPKRIKTETPVPIPQPAMSVRSGGSVPPTESISSLGAASSSTAAPPAPYARHSTTPVPAPAVGQLAADASQHGHHGPAPVPPPATISRQSTSSSSLLSSGGLSAVSGAAPGGTAATSGATAVTTTTVPLKPPAAATPVPLPVQKAATPIYPPVRELRARDPARKEQQQQQQQQQLQVGPEEGEGGTRASRASSRAVTPGTAAQPLTSTEPSNVSHARRPSSRGASISATHAPDTATPSSLAADRPRRASTARTTPAPEVAAAGGANAAASALSASAAAAAGGRPATKRVKRPAPGIVSRTSSGGSAAVGRRKAAPRRKRGSNVAQQRRESSRAASGTGGGRDDRGDKDWGAEADGDVEVDDDGNVIDPNEARYCVCNRVSFGTMIQCDNVENCKQEWFHLECVGLTAVPARTTKWYCPDCRVLLNIGEKGEVSARGVKM